MLKKLFLCISFIAVILWAFCQTNLNLTFSIPYPSPPDTTYISTYRMHANGDINGDGFDDILIESRMNQALGFDKVSIYLGSTTLQSVPDLVLLNPSPTMYSAFGHGIFYNADLNGDGYDDIVVAAPTYGYANWGRVYIYYGAAVPDTTIDVVLEGFNYGSDAWGLEFGNVIDTSGDFNSDGYKDLVVGSRGPGGINFGQVDIFYCGPGFDTVADWHYQGSQLSSNFGSRITAGDINGDGFDDLAVYSPNSNENNAEQLYIFLGGQNFDTSPDNIETIALGNPMLLDEDVNGDGYNDLLTEAPYYALSIKWGAQIIQNGFSPITTTMEEYFTSLFYVRNSNELLFAGYELMNSVFRMYVLNDSLRFVLRYEQPFSAPIFSQLSYYLGDVNDDGHADIAIKEYNNGIPFLNIYSIPAVANEDENCPDITNDLFCYPNPCKDNVMISYHLTDKSDIRLQIYNIKGQLVSTLKEGLQDTGKHSITWVGRDKNGKTLPNGVYTISLVSNSGRETRKITILH